MPRSRACCSRRASADLAGPTAGRGWIPKLPILILAVAGVSGACAGDGRSGLGVLPHFVDVTALSGLPAAGLTSGAVLVDLDGDGQRDLILGRHGLLPEAYRNRGGLHFERLPGWGGGLDVFDHHATLVDDIDGDGRPDFYFVVGAHRGEGLGNKALWLSSMPDSLHISERWGVQDPFGRGRGALMVDVEGDGTRDLFVFNFKTAMRAFALAPPGPMRDRVGGLFGFIPADDAAVGRAVGHGDASRTERIRGDWVLELLPQDLDADGRPDYFALGSPPARILRFAGGRVVPELMATPPEATARAPVAGCWGDFDDDGRSDLFLVYGEDDAASEIQLPRRNRLLMWSDGHVTEAADTSLAMGGWGKDCVAADLDNNGTLDLLVQQTHRADKRTRTRVLLNEGNAHFTKLADSVLLSPDLRGIADGLLVADLDNDGDLDVLELLGGMEANEPIGGGVRLLRNDLDQATPAPHWLDVVLDSVGHGLPYGARVEIEAGGVRQHRQYWPCQMSGSAFACPLHVGLGAATTVEVLTVRWPDGQASTLTQLQADRSVTLKHP